MATDIPMPSYSETMEEADLIGWLVSPGDFVHEGDPIAEIETDKATGELESPVSGTLVEICVPEGTSGVKVGSVVARVDVAEPPPSPETSDEPTAAQETAAAEPAPAAAEPVPEAVPPTPAAAAEAPIAAGPGTSATALARRVAEQSGLDLAQLQGTGSRGRITKADVEAAAAGPAYRTSTTAAAVAVLDVECDVSKALHVCRQASEREAEIEIDLLSLVVRAAGLAVREVPEVAGITADGEATFTLSVQAVDRPARAIREADRKSLAILAGEFEGDSGPSTDAPCLEIFDFGSLGIRRVQPAMPSGAAAALGMGAPHPAEPGAAPALATFTLSVDTGRTHIAVAARWFSEFRRRVEDPLEMLL